MKTISDETIDQTWQEFVAMIPDAFANLLSDFAREQPFVLSYLMAADEERLNEDERELLVFLGTIIWRIMSPGDAPLPTIPAEKVIAAEDNNFQMLVNIQNKNEMDYDEAVVGLLQNYNQLALLNFVTNIMLEDEEWDVRENNLGAMMIYLKTVIDSLDN